MNRHQLETAIAIVSQQTTAEQAVKETIIKALQHQLTQLEQQETAHAALKGERKQVTVMFADISGFTAMSEKLDPEEVRNMINACFEHLGVVIKRYDGHIDKFIGDEIMALFGAPIAHENDPERALRAALGMMTALTDFNTTHADKIPKPLGLHFGINTGVVIAGGIGTAERRDYSVIGDTVNLAARLEDLSETGEILVGEQTYRLTAALFDFEPLPPVQVKGKEKPVQVYRLLRAKTSQSQVRGIAGLYSDMVGRHTEVSILANTLTQLQNGQGSAISVIGDAGLGKSRLVRELYEANRQGKLVWAKGNALSYEQDASYLVAQHLLCNLLGLSADDPITTIDQALQAELYALFPTTATEVYPYLASLLELPLEPQFVERVRYLEGEALHKRIHQAYWDYLVAKAAQTPLVLTWDDLHWADPSSFSLLQALLPLMKTRPIIFVLVYRSLKKGRVWDFHQQLYAENGNGLAWKHCLELQPLSLEESHQLVANLMGRNPQTEPLRELIVRKSEGNPFFVEEVIRSLIDNGTLIRADNDEDCFITQDPTQTITIPDTLQGVIMARIDQLEPETKRILQVAAVIGRYFSQDILADVLEHLQNIPEG